MQRLALFLIGALVFSLLISQSNPVWAHGIVGKRFFPAGLSVDDPFPADELTLAKPGYIHGPEGKESSVGVEYQKRLSPNLGLSIEGDYSSTKPEDSADPTLRGWSNPEFSLIYSMFRSPEHEYIASASVSASPGGYGSRDVREEMSSISPSFEFGRGLGDLPDSVQYLKPFAVIGQFGAEVPWGRNDDPAELATYFNYGLSLQYSIPYLQSFVKDVGIPRPFNKMFPFVELTYSNAMSGPQAHHDGTGYWYPGVLWAGKYVELGLEAEIPLNNRTGNHTGVIGLIHLFLDDISPKSFAWTPFSGNLGGTQTR